MLKYQRLYSQGQQINLRAILITFLLHHIHSMIHRSPMDNFHSLNWNEKLINYVNCKIKCLSYLADNSINLYIALLPSHHKLLAIHASSSGHLCSQSPSFGYNPNSINVSLAVKLVCKSNCCTNDAFVR